MDFNKASKTLCDSVHTNNNAQFVYVGFSSGSKDEAFALLPALAKLLRNLLDEQVKRYESQYGEIDMTGAQKLIPSPIQQK